MSPNPSPGYSELVAGKRKRRRGGAIRIAPGRRHLQHFLSCYFRSSSPPAFTLPSIGRRATNRWMMSFSRSWPTPRRGSRAWPTSFSRSSPPGWPRALAARSYSGPGQVERRIRPSGCSATTSAVFESHDRQVVSLVLDDNSTGGPKGFLYGGWGSRTGIRFPTGEIRSIMLDAKPSWMRA